MTKKKKTTTNVQVVPILTLGLPIAKSVKAALKSNNQSRSLNTIIKALAKEDDHVTVIAGCIGAMAGLILAKCGKEDA